MTQEPRPPRNGLFSAFRLFFVIGIVAFHFAPRWFVASSPWLCSGSAFVSFFFVLSGFLWWMSASHSLTFSTPRFVARRLSNYLPLVYAGLAWYVAKIAVQIVQTGSTSRGTLLSLGLHLTFAQSWIPPYPLSLNGPAWFMSCLVTFVFLFPLAFRYVTECSTRPRTFLLVALSLWAGTQVVNTALLNNASLYPGTPSAGHDLIYYSPLSHLCSFVLGLALGHWLASAGRRLPRTWVSVVVFSCSVLAVFGALQLGWARLIHVRLPLGVSFYAPLFGCLVLAIAMLRGRILRLFDNRVVDYIGRVSFPIFIFQAPMREIWTRIPLISQARLTAEVDFLLYLATLVIVACLFQSLIHDRARRLLMAAFRRVGSTTRSPRTGAGN